MYWAVINVAHLVDEHLEINAAPRRTTIWAYASHAWLCEQAEAAAEYMCQSLKRRSAQIGSPGG
jgi:hypothetical protein